MPPDRELAARTCELAGCEEVFDATVTQRLLAGRARDNPSTQRRVFVRLRKVSDEVSARAQLAFNLRTGCAGAECRVERSLVDGHKLVQLLERNVHNRTVGSRHRKMSDDTRATAVR